MANSITITKRQQIDKASATMVVIIAVASFIVVFSFIASRALLSQRSYQARVISKKEQARDQLKTNLDNAGQLTTAYQAFVNTSSNIIGGNPVGSGDKDGDNAKIVLDALPSSYDFPALATSVEKLLDHKGLNIQSISGADDEINQQANSTSSTPSPVSMPFEATVEGNFSSFSTLLSTLELSIRPIKMQKLSFQGDEGNLTLTITAQAYFQPGVSLKLSSEVVK